MPRKLNKHLLNPVSVLFYLAILIQKIGLLSVRYRANRQVTAKISEILLGIEVPAHPSIVDSGATSKAF
jgi:hypothetical protein